MARKTFTQAVKQQAVAEMSIGNLTQKQIAEKYGCSVPALQVWRRELQDNPPAEEEEWAAEEAPETCECDCQCTQQDAQELMRQFWSKGNRAVDMLLTPKAVSAEDAVKLVNEALQFACDQK